MNGSSDYNRNKEDRNDHVGTILLAWGYLQPLLACPVLRVICAFNAFPKSNDVPF